MSAIIDISDAMLAVVEENNNLTETLSLLAKATPGEWRMYRCNWAGKGDACGVKSEPFVSDNEDSYQRGVVYDTNRDECGHAMALADAALIAAAPRLLRALVEELTAMTAMAESLRESLDSVCERCQDRCKHTGPEEAA